MSCIVLFNAYILVNQTHSFISLCTMFCNNNNNKIMTLGLHECKISVMNGKTIFPTIHLSLTTTSIAFERYLIYCANLGV